MLLLLPVVIRKLKRSVPSLLPHPPVLAHTIYQAISFDGALREDGFDLSGTSAAAVQGKNEWKGISDTVLGRSDWFNAWLQGEKKCTSFDLVGHSPFLAVLITVRSVHSDLCYLCHRSRNMGFCSRPRSIPQLSYLGRSLAPSRWTGGQIRSGRGLEAHEFGQEGRGFDRTSYRSGNSLFVCTRGP